MASPGDPEPDAVSGLSGAPSHGRVVRLVEFVASDGAELVGDLVLPPAARAGAIVCHPHPQYGGNRHNAVVGAIWDALADAGVAALRFDFRATFDHGVGELRDAAAAIDELADHVPSVPLVAIGYSFGALVAAGLADDRVTALVLVAAPLSGPAPIPAPTVPTLVLIPAHDQFAPPSTMAPILSEWRAASAVTIDSAVIESADHSLTGRTAVVAAHVVEWLTSQR